MICTRFVYVPKYIFVLRENTRKNNAIKYFKIYIEQFFYNVYSITLVFKKNYTKYFKIKFMHFII